MACNCYRLSTPRYSHLPCDHPSDPLACLSIHHPPEADTPLCPFPPPLSMVVSLVYLSPATLRSWSWGELGVPSRVE